MMNGQEIILGVILMICIAWIIRRIHLCYKRIKGKTSPCEGCPCGCTKHEDCCPIEKKITISSKKNHKTLADSKNSRTFATAIEKQR